MEYSKLQVNITPIGSNIPKAISPSLKQCDYESSGRDEKSSMSYYLVCIYVELKDTCIVVKGGAKGGLGGCNSLVGVGTCWSPHREVRNSEHSDEKAKVRLLGYYVYINIYKYI